MASRNEEKFPLNPASYEWYEQVGEGTSATVYRALCIPFKRIVAIKVLDMERCNSNLDDIRREAQTMSLIDHPNLLRAHCSFVVDQHLWVVMPYMGGGSCLHIMKAAFENGFEELVIASILREVLKALDYLHRQGHIHRDVKAGNILVDDNGAVKVADFGVSAFMFDMGDRQRSRNTFVGTPCWMAPEVMEQLHGYNFKADIWSFGITALELARGHAPFSKYPPMKVLLMTLQNAPPGLDYERDKRFSKSFKELISICLAKDPSKRPSAEKLLKHSFFKQARSNGYLSHILDGLPPLVERIKSLKIKEEHLLAQRKMSLVHEEEKSQNEYKRGISAWNFDLEELKAQAALIKDDEGFIVANEKLKNQETVVHDSHPHVPMDNQLATFIESSEEKNHKKEMQRDSQIHGGPVSSFPPKVINGLRGQFDICEDDIQKHVKTKEIQDLEKDTEQLVNVASKYPVENILSSNSDDTSCNGTSTSGKNIEECREKQLCRLPSKKQSTGSLISNVSKDTNVAECCNGSSLDEKSRKAAIQQKGRFKVMAGSTDQEANKVSCTERRKNNTVVPQTFAANQMLHIQADTTSIPVSTILPHLQQLLHQNIVQSEMIANVTRHICQGESCTDYQPHKAEAKHSTHCRDDNSVALSNKECEYLLQINELESRYQNGLKALSNKECEYLLQINELESRLSALLHEVQKWKLKNVQLEQQLKDKTSNGYRPRN